MGGRRFVEGLYQALFSFRHARQNVIYKSETKIEPDLRLSLKINDVIMISLLFVKFINVLANFLILIIFRFKGKN